MIANDTYCLMPTVIRRLHLAGEWDAALALSGDGDEGATLRAELLVDRNFWQRTGGEAAAEAVAALDPASVQARYLGGKLAYSRLLFAEDADPDDRATTEAGYRAAAEDKELHGWGELHSGTFQEHIAEDKDAAEAHYRKALAASRDTGDLLLESYAVRHLGGLAFFERGEKAEGEQLLRRSLHLRAAAGARPQTAAAQATLAQALAEDASERATLIEAARTTATELRLTWLLGSLAEL
ncbi:hypothetical protein [Yinghuangia soli]|uniref:Tetratricopeptide repeat protein n=1 Tax=Yinghuangia soli TaxID=2908204 RepID=A0AA41PWW5_9ACTN|nr:hypothetical protein [Yinghuangia soli]MCF2527329.1 hypothetical protein [Yinghuangia soli]